VALYQGGTFNEADFDSKLGFVFYNAELYDLQISAFYK
jgi:hypothetical protein